MNGLIQKLFEGRKDKQRVSTTLSADEIQPFFKLNGIDIETIGFPDIEYRKHDSDHMKYRIYFNAISTRFIKVTYQFS